MTLKFEHYNFQDLGNFKVGDYVYIKGLLNRCIKAEAVGFINEIAEHRNYGTYLFPHYYGKCYIFISFYTDEKNYSKMLFVNINEIYKLKFPNPTIKNALPSLIRREK